MEKDISQLIVRVFTDKSRETGQKKFLGTAFIVDKTHLLTARHVVQSIHVDFRDDTRLLFVSNGPSSWNGKVRLSQVIPHNDDAIDIALLKLNPVCPEPPEFWPLRNEKLRNKQQVWIPGFDSEDNPSVHTPHFVKSWDSTFSSKILQDKVAHGQSGSPVLLDGEIVGLLYARSDDSNPENDNHESHIYPYAIFEEFLLKHGVEPLSPSSSNQTGVPAAPSFNIDPKERIVFLDREEQWDKHMWLRINQHPGKTCAFVVAGVKDEWPDSLEHRLRIELQIARDEGKFIQPGYSANDKPSREKAFWDELLAKLPGAKASPCQNFAQVKDAKQQLTDALSACEKPQLFIWRLNPAVKEHFDPETLKHLLQCWERLEITAPCPRHYLLVIHGDREKRLFNGAQKDVKKWRDRLASLLNDGNLSEIVTPALESPDWAAINHWLALYIRDEEKRLELDEALQKLQGIFRHRNRIPLKTIYDQYLKLNSLSKAGK